MRSGKPQRVSWRRYLPGKYRERAVKGDHPRIFYGWFVAAGTFAVTFVGLMERLCALRLACSFTPRWQVEMPAIVSDFPALAIVGANQAAFRRHADHGRHAGPAHVAS